jgi:hypothetical protein
MLTRKSIAAVLSLAAFSYGCGGGGQILGPEGQLTFTTSNRVIVVAPTRFEATLRVSNPTTTPITVSVTCLGVIVYSNAARTGTPIYDSRPSTVCTASQETFQPNATKTYSLQLTSATVLGSSTPVGVYYLDVAMDFGKAKVILPAGSVDLRR